MITNTWLLLLSFMLISNFPGFKIFWVREVCQLISQSRILCQLLLQKNFLIFFTSFFVYGAFYDTHKVLADGPKKLCLFICDKDKEVYFTKT